MGTDTEVGKTYAASLLARSYRHSGARVGVYKPVASGCAVVDGKLVAQDALQLWQAAGQPRTLDEVCPQRFEAPLAPNEAAKAAGKTVDRGRLRQAADVWQQSSDVLIIEGAGGLLSPLADDYLNIDLVRQFMPARVILVAANRLGTIHQTLATCAAAKQFDIPVTGIMLSDTSKNLDASSETNAEQIRRHCDVPVLCGLAYGADSIPKSVLEALGQPLQ